MTTTTPLGPLSPHSFPVAPSPELSSENSAQILDQNSTPILFPSPPPPQEQNAAQLQNTAVAPPFFRGGKGGGGEGREGGEGSDQRPSSILSTSSLNTHNSSLRLSPRHPPLPLPHSPFESLSNNEDGHRVHHSSNDNTNNNNNNVYTHNDVIEPFASAASSIAPLRTLKTVMARPSGDPLTTLTTSKRTVSWADLTDTGVSLTTVKEYHPEVPASPAFSDDSWDHHHHRSTNGMGCACTLM